jgi:predicted Zn-dependent protease with MMP-like domain
VPTPYDQALRALESGDPEGALDLTLRALQVRSVRADRELELDLRSLAVDCLFALGRMRESLPHIGRLRVLAEGGEIPALLEGIARYHIWDLDGARERFAGLAFTGDDQAELLTYRARLLELESRFAEADELYESAAVIAPATFSVPVRLSEEEVGGIVRDVLGSLPPDVQEAVANVIVEVRPMPDPRVHAGPDTDPDLLGLYTGVNVLERSASQPVPGLDRVLLFQRNIERAAADRDEVREEIRVTLLHEIGHHVGWDEHDLADRGLD